MGGDQVHWSLDQVKGGPLILSRLCLFLASTAVDLFSNKPRRSVSFPYSLSPFDLRQITQF